MLQPQKHTVTTRALSLIHKRSLAPSYILTSISIWNALFITSEVLNWSRAKACKRKMHTLISFDSTDELFLTWSWLCQHLCRKYIQSTCHQVLRKRFKNRNVVTRRLSTCWSYNRNILPTNAGLNGLRLNLRKKIHLWSLTNWMNKRRNILQYLVAICHAGHTIPVPQHEASEGREDQVISIASHAIRLVRLATF
jgi:hypothetical protein